ncbi:AlpA family transcriptional regulator [uncultured Streptococcus sp.]|uniref:helix-turn-helix transcriptional regulator n=1 Tax=uncultured Streptococcus sp. TaxID=83427 RepID=UPI0025E08633|nr:DNA-binding protein [uncultured Streptococcus sp.]
MDSIMQQFSEWLKTSITETLNKILEIEKDDDLPELLDGKQTAQFLGVSATTFATYRRLDDFPKQLPHNKWSKRAIKEWLKEQR